MTMHGMQRRLPCCGVVIVCGLQLRGPACRTPDAVASCHAGVIMGVHGCSCCLLILGMTVQRCCRAPLAMSASGVMSTFGTWQVRALLECHNRCRVILRHGMGAAWHGMAWARHGMAWHGPSMT